MFICRAVPYDLFLQGALPFSIIPRSAMPLAKARTPFVLVPRTYSQPSNLPCPKEGFDLNPQPLSPLQGRGLKKNRSSPSIIFMFWYCGTTRCFFLGYRLEKALPYFFL